MKIRQDKPQYVVELNRLREKILRVDMDTAKFKTMEKRIYFLMNELQKV